jgi:hypothetical protein
MKKNAEETVKVQVTVAELAKLRRRAEREELTLSGLFRQGVGLTPRDRGGARKGAGRPKKETAEL